MSDMLSGGDMLIRALQEKALIVYLAIQVVPYCIFTMLFSNSKKYSMF